MKVATSFSILLFGMLLSFTMFAQTNKPKPKPVVKDTVAPKLIARFGPYADSAKVPAGVMKQIVKSELKVSDEKDVVYYVIAFSFSWKRKDLTDDFKTGTPKTIFLYNSVDVKGDAHIPAAWQQEIKDNVQAKEEMRFDGILVQNPKTKKLYKPGTVTLFVL